MNMVIKHVFEICAHMLADLWCTCHTHNSAHHNAYSYMYIGLIIGKGNTQSLFYNTFESIHCVIC